MATVNFYDHYVTTHYRSTVGEQSYIKRYYVWKSYLEKYIPSDKNISFLEVGCGMGHNIYALRKLGYKNIVGIDYSAECVDICKERGFDALLINERNESKFYKAYAHSFDLIILYDVLEHYVPTDGVILLRFIKQSLKDNGTIFISTPNASHPLSSNLLFADTTHKFIYTQGSLLQLLQNVGFTKNIFFQINSYTLYDESIVIQLFKQTILRGISFIGEYFWKAVGLTQGIILTQCKPTLVCIAQI
ncbi:class I SAM-dependent methyltransferase [Candidatus Gottesmanbacteria bacterium]|nr:class I SAM-dependent methyltransferase [Candidatus Gottesmanbacteria bacterium]